MYLSNTIHIFKNTFEVNGKSILNTAALALCYTINAPNPLDTFSRCFGEVANLLPTCYGPVSDTTHTTDFYPRANLLRTCCGFGEATEKLV